MSVPKIGLRATARCARRIGETRKSCGKETREARWITAFAGLEDSLSYPDLEYVVPMCDEHAKEYDDELGWMYRTYPPSLR